MRRREFLKSSACGLGMLGSMPLVAVEEGGYQSVTPPAFSVVPVVGDGKWIWTQPPTNKGFLEPRKFELIVGMRFTGRGPSKNLVATTVAPVEFPEQKILDLKIKKQNCTAEIVPISQGGAQMIVNAGVLNNGQTVSASAHFLLEISKSHFGFEKNQFDSKQRLDRQISRQYLKSSPGIKIASREVRDVVAKLSGSRIHPWELSKKFYEFVWEHIRGVPGKYTSVEEAIKNRVGDCEERACTFIALCRAAGIPARQVWIPNHVWAEFALHDESGIWHWIPVHTAAYSWFGWTGAHEVVLQKGDRFKLPFRNRVVRLIDDWYRISGPRPNAEFFANIRPLGDEQNDSGPGAREKRANGTWELVGNHPLDVHMRGD